MMKKTWSVLLTANILSALANPLLTHAVAPQKPTQQSDTSNLIAQSDTIRQSLESINQTLASKGTEDSATDTTTSLNSQQYNGTTETLDKSSTETINSDSLTSSKLYKSQSKAVKATKQGTWGNVSWEFNTANGVLTFTSGGTLGGYKTSPWRTGGSIDSEAITKIIFTQSVKAPKDSQFLFSTDFESNNYLFNCQSIEGIDKVDVSSVTNMYGMFAKLSGLTSLDLSSWNVSKVTDMRFMFEGLFNLPSSSDIIRYLNISSFSIKSNKPLTESMFDGAQFDKITVGSTFNVVPTDTVTPNFPQFTKWYDEDGKSVGSSFMNNPSFLEYLASGHPGTYTTYKEEPPVEDVLKWGDVPYKFDETSGILTFMKDGENKLGTYTTSPWNRTDGKAIDASKVKQIVFNSPVIAPTNSQYLFSSSGKKLSSLTKIEGLEKIDTSSTTDMSYMFTGMSGMKSLDVSQWSTEKVTKMYAMFYQMSSLETLNVSNLKTSNVTNMGLMFSGLVNLKELDTSTLDVSKVTYMERMYANMSSLEKIILPKTTTDSATNMVSMFDGNKSLVTLDVSNLKTTKVGNMNRMFAGMVNLSSLDLGGFDFSNTTNKKQLFLNDQKLQQLTLPESFSDVTNETNLTDVPTNDVFDGNWVNINDKTNLLGQTAEFLKNTANKPGTYVWGDKTTDMLKWGEVPYRFDEKTGILTFYKNGDNKLGNYHSSPWNRTDGKAIDASKINKIVFTSKVIAPENCAYLFSSTGTMKKLDQLTDITGLENLDTSTAINMGSMFYQLRSIKSLNLSSFDTSNVTIMSSMFEGVSSLESLDVSHFDTSKVTTMTYMFYGMNDLIDLNLGNKLFNTSNVINMRAMFDDVSSLKQLDVSHFNTSNVTDMSGMFEQMTSLTSLDVTNFDTSQVKTMKSMFNETKSLTSIDVSNFTTSKVENMEQMFAGMEGIRSLGLESFDFSSVKSKTNMFDGDTIQSITLPKTFSDKENGTQLNQVPQNEIYNGNWVNINDKNTKLGNTTEFLANYNGQAGTYVWGKNGDLRLVEVPDAYDFGDKNRSLDVNQIVTPTGAQQRAIKIEDTREQPSPWTLNVQASELLSENQGVLTDASFYFKMTSTNSNNMPMLDVPLEKRMVLSTDNTPQAIVKVKDNNNQPDSYVGIVENMKLFVAANSAKSNEQYKGTITWSLDRLPTD